MAHTSLLTKTPQERRSRAVRNVYTRDDIKIEDSNALLQRRHRESFDDLLRGLRLDHHLLAEHHLLASLGRWLRLQLQHCQTRDSELPRLDLLSSNCCKTGEHLLAIGRFQTSCCRDRSIEAPH